MLGHCFLWPVRCRCSWRSEWSRRACRFAKPSALSSTPCERRKSWRPGNRTATCCGKPDRDVLRLQDELADLLGAQVAIRANQRGAGKVLIEFGDLDQLEGILQRLRH
ncbi:MAG: putative chromosome-partitioning protein ParB [Candidatus Accumulibacter sp. BA-94]|nr:MAG: putative chromosome-partitioning protein ParB [Candidatus Accumulibacter sp. BA-94]